MASVVRDLALDILSEDSASKQIFLNREANLEYAEKAPADLSSLLGAKFVRSLALVDKGRGNHLLDFLRCAVCDQYFPPPPPRTDSEFDQDQDEQDYWLSRAKCGHLVCGCGDGVCRKCNLYIYMEDATDMWDSADQDLFDLRRVVHAKRWNGAMTDLPPTSVAESIEELTSDAFAQANVIGAPPTKVCVFLDLHLTLVDAPYAKGGRRRIKGYRPHAVELVRSMWKLQLEGVCRLCFFTAWEKYNMQCVVNSLLEEATSLNWIHSERGDYVVHPEGQSEQEVLCLDEDFTEPEFEHYFKHKDFYRVWQLVTSHDEACRESHSVYVTCSTETMWNANEHVLEVSPWKGDEDSRDLLDVCRYLSDMIDTFTRQGLVSVDVPIYLQLHRFQSVDRIALDDFKADLRTKLELVHKTGVLYRLPTTCSLNKRRIAHVIAEELQLKHESFGKGPERQLVIWKEGSDRRCVPLITRNRCFDCLRFVS
eukprot:TRINITY_DN16793_c0_g1_i1.p1 TRINITY_DN16793_c0_g1~~TRINITY_DN16793_c0_g1_i1.p1  ORF type:complete len:481 (+),score=48.51 TRINITY_DN16793_c0_g1_i1:45-1487(+)